MVKDKEYLVLETMYKKMYQDNNNIFPNEWYNVKKYELKKKILRECLENNILIINSTYYYGFRLKSLNS